MQTFVVFSCSLSARRGPFSCYFVFLKILALLHCLLYFSPLLFVVLYVYCVEFLIASPFLGLSNTLTVILYLHSQSYPPSTLLQLSSIYTSTVFLHLLSDSFPPSTLQQFSSIYTSTAFLHLHSYCFPLSQM